jgi:hemolysin activation/secretion protein
VETDVFGYALRLDPTYYAFYDRGWTFDKLESDPDRHLSSLGIGVRMAINQRVEAQLEGVRRLTRRPSGADLPEQKEDALFWRVLARF